MLSRVADTLYWMARYLERAENTARLINATSNLHLDLPRGSPVDWPSLLGILGKEDYPGEGHADDEARVTAYLIAGETNPSAIGACVAAARENARTVRELLPREGWESINALHALVRARASSTGGRRARADFLRELILHCQQIAGVLAGTFSHGAPYQCVLIGQYLERADMTTRIIDVRAATLLSTPTTGAAAMRDDPGWMSVLRSLGAYTMYRQSVTPRISGPAVVDFLLQNPEFPRAVRHCLNRLDTALAVLLRGQPARRAVADLTDHLDGPRPPEKAPAELHEHIDQIQTELADLNWAIHEAFYTVER